MRQASPYRAKGTMGRSCTPEHVDAAVATR